MKKFILLLIVPFLSFGQDYTNNGISYQAVARDASGGILTNETISVKFRIVDNPYGEGQVYEEYHSVTTDSYGLFTVSIGTGNTNINADETYPADGFDDISWGSYDYCGLAVSIDFNGDGVYADMGVMKMEDVPTAKWAKNAENASNADGELLETIINLQTQINNLQEQINTMGASVDLLEIEYPNVADYVLYCNLDCCAGFFSIPGEYQDTDGDGIYNYDDLDADNDGILNEYDPTPLGMSCQGIGCWPEEGWSLTEEVINNEIVYVATCCNEECPVLGVFLVGSGLSYIESAYWMGGPNEAQFDAPLNTTLYISDDGSTNFQCIDPDDGDGETIFWYNECGGMYEESTFISVLLLFDSIEQPGPGQTYYYTLVLELNSGSSVTTSITIPIQMAP